MLGKMVVWVCEILLSIILMLWVLGISISVVLISMFRFMVIVMLYMWKKGMVVMVILWFFCSLIIYEWYCLVFVIRLWWVSIVFLGMLVVLLVYCSSVMLFVVIGIDIGLGFCSFVMKCIGMVWGLCLNELFVSVFFFSVLIGKSRFLGNGSLF